MTYQNTFQNNNGIDERTMRRIAPSIYAGVPHTSRSSRYTYIPTAAIITALAKEGFVPTQVMQARARDVSRRETSKHLIRFRAAHDLGWNKPEVYEVILVNSHDGSSTYNLYAGIFRLVCSNGCISGDFTDTIKIRHSGDIVNNVVEGTLAIASHSQEIMTKVDEMKAVELWREEQLLLAEFGLKARELNKNIYQPADLLRRRRKEDQGNDLYTTYQVIQENAIKGGLTHYDQDATRYTTHEITSISTVVKVNTLLWQFTERLLEMKQGK